MCQKEIPSDLAAKRRRPVGAVILDIRASHGMSVFTFLSGAKTNIEGQWYLLSEFSYMYRLGDIGNAKTAEGFICTVAKHCQ